METNQFIVSKHSLNLGYEYCSVVSARVCGVTLRPLCLSRLYPHGPDGGITCLLRKFFLQRLNEIIYVIPLVHSRCSIPARLFCSFSYP